MIPPRDWPWYLGAVGVAAAVGLVIALRERGAFERELPLAQVVPLPRPPADPLPAGARGRLVGGETVSAVPGRTYFVALETNGSVHLAASADRVEAFARKQGFVDVVVEEDEPLSNWPIAPNDDADYFVRGTFAGPTPRAFARENGVFGGSAILLDVVEA